MPQSVAPQATQHGKVSMGKLGV